MDISFCKDMTLKLRVKGFKLFDCYGLQILSFDDRHPVSLLQQRESNIAEIQKHM